MKNYYDVFGVPPTASPKDIDAAHKSLAKKYHPDINNSEDAHEKMAMLNKANEILSDTTKRERYDRALKMIQVKQQDRESEQRASKAEQLRKRAETQEKAIEEARMRRDAEANKKAAKTELQHARAESERLKKIAEVERQDVIKVLLSLIRGNEKRQLGKTPSDAERKRELEVLISLLKTGDERLRRMAEEKERQQRIQTILSLLKEDEEDAMVD